jgi:hypothetical protein
MQLSGCREEERAVRRKYEYAHDGQTSNVDRLCTHHPSVTPFLFPPRTTESSYRTAHSRHPPRETGSFVFAIVPGRGTRGTRLGAGDVTEQGEKTVRALGTVVQQHRYRVGRKKGDEAREAEEAFATARSAQGSDETTTKDDKNERRVMNKDVLRIKNRYAYKWSPNV